MHRKDEGGQLSRLRGAAALSKNGACPMQVAVRPAIPAVLPRSASARGGRDRWLRWVANTVTVLSAALAIVMVGLAAVVMGLT